MSLFDSASLVVTPNGVKEGKLYSIKPTDGSGDLSVTRATTATRVNSAGLVEVVPYNLFSYSEQFDNSFWNKNDCSVSANAIAAPNGTLTADKLIENSSNSVHLINTPNNSVPTGTNTLSVYAKADTRNWILLYLFDGVLGSLTAYFNVSNGTLGTIASGLTASIDSVGNGWYRCSITRTQANAGNGGYGLASADNVASYTGNGTSGAYFWGGQLVAGTSAKDYLKTETRLNIPRLDYTNGTCPSILVEPQRTNIATYSELFDNGNWNKQAITLTANNTAAPDGTLTADLISANTTNGEHNVYSNIFLITPNVDYTFSYFVKKGTGRYMAVAIYYVGGITGFGAYATYDLNTNTLVASGAPNGTFTGTKIETFANGWVKISVTGKGNAVGAIVDIDIRNAANLVPGVFYTGANETFNIWGAQFEQGSYATSYIPTVASSVTRNADVISKAGISSLIGQTEGTMFIDFYFDSTKIDSGSILIPLKLSQSTTKTELVLYSDGRVQVTHFNSGSLTCNIDLPSYGLTNNRHKIAFGYKANDFVLYIDGVLAGTDTSGTVGVQDSISLKDITYPSVTKDNAVALWKTRLTNAELATLTTI
jgi:hypothetical protein